MVDKPNVLLIVIDCLRADRLFAPDRTCKTPHIDKLVEQGTSLTNIFVENSITAPSFTSIFTGRYAGNHGIIGQVGVKLGPQVSTMADIFSESGYHTYAEVTGPLNPIIGVDKGFTHYHFRNQKEYFFTNWGKDLLSRLRNGDFEPPFFLLVHLWEVHVPRQIQPEFNSPEYGATRYDRSLSGLDPFVGELIEAAGKGTACILTGDHGECVGELPPNDTLLPYFLEKLKLPPLDMDRVEQVDNSGDLMQEEPLVHHFFTELSQVVEENSKMGLKKRIMMLVRLLRIGITRYRLQLRKSNQPRKGFLSGMKEKINDLRVFFDVARGKPEAAQLQLIRSSLSEHALQHGYHIYDYLQQVPAVFAWDGIFPKGCRVDTELRHIDLLPTLIEAFSLKGPADGFDGTSYYDLMRNGGGDNRAVYLEARGGAQAGKIFLIRGVRRDGRKIAYAPFEANSPVEFYNLYDDPNETNSLSRVEVDKVEALREEAEAMGASFSADSAQDLSAKENIEMVKRLKSLGYM